MKEDTIEFTPHISYSAQEFADSCNSFAPVIRETVATDNQLILSDITHTQSAGQSMAYSMIELVAHWFLSRSSLSNKKLQKLCYYAYAWFIVFYNDLESVDYESEDIKVMFSEKFQAWIHGPVNPKLYFIFRKYGWMEIQQLKKQSQ